MSDHIPDVTKMIGDTPRSNAAQWIADDGSGGIHSVVSLCEARKLERELNAANERIKRLEEAGDALEYISVILEGEEDPNGFEKLLIAQREWHKAKEAKP